MEETVMIIQNISSQLLHKVVLAGLEGRSGAFI